MAISSEKQKKEREEIKEKRISHFQGEFFREAKIDREIKREIIYKEENKYLF